MTPPLGYKGWCHLTPLSIRHYFSLKCLSNFANKANASFDFPLAACLLLNKSCL